MKCPIENGEPAKLLVYSAGQLTAEDKAALELHLAECPGCSERAASQRAIWNAMSEWDAAPVSADFNRRLYARIDLEESRRGALSKWARSWSARWTPLSWRPVMPGAAALAMLIGAMFIPWARDSRLTNAVQTPTEAKVERIDADQVERALDDLDMLKQLGTSTSAM